jgi:hypothetical protein
MLTSADIYYRRRAARARVGVCVVLYYQRGLFRTEGVPRGCPGMQKKNLKKFKKIKKIK